MAVTKREWRGPGYYACVQDGGGICGPLGMLEQIEMDVFVGEEKPSEYERQYGGLYAVRRLLEPEE